MARSRAQVDEARKALADARKELADARAKEEAIESAKAVVSEADAAEAEARHRVETERVLSEHAGVQSRRAAASDEALEVFIHALKLAKAANALLREEEASRDRARVVLAGPNPVSGLMGVNLDQNITLRGDADKIPAQPVDVAAGIQYGQESGDLALKRRLADEGLLDLHGVQDALGLVRQILGSIPF